MSANETQTGGNQHYAIVFLTAKVLIIIFSKRELYQCDLNLKTVFCRYLHTNNEEKLSETEIKCIPKYPNVYTHIYCIA